jgi:ankyrin repeat protein
MGHVLENQSSLDYCEKPFFRTALWEATWKNHEDIVRLLVEKRASVHVEDYQKRTPLHEAAYYGHGNLVDFLIEHGHPINCVDKFGQTPVFRAVEGGRRAVVELLVSRGADVALMDEDNVTAQHLAAFHGMPQLSEWLLYKGAYRNRFAISERTHSARSSSPRVELNGSGSEFRSTTLSSRSGEENLDSARQKLPPGLPRPSAAGSSGGSASGARRPSNAERGEDVGLPRRTSNQFIKELTMKVY